MALETSAERPAPLRQVAQLVAGWVDRLAPIFSRLNADPALHTYEIHPSRTGPY